MRIEVHQATKRLTPLQQRSAVCASVLYLVATSRFGRNLVWTLAPLGFPFERVSGSQFRAGLSAAYLVATLSLVGLLLVYRTRDSFRAFRFISKDGAMMPIAVMLLLAWAMGDILSLLGTDATSQTG